jgi:lipopolysaccharide export LptBFGC system permease protein LptF
LSPAAAADDVLGSNMTTGQLFLLSAGAFITALLLLNGLNRRSEDGAARAGGSMLLVLVMYLAGAAAVLSGLGLVIRFLLSLA